MLRNETLIFVYIKCGATEEDIWIIIFIGVFQLDRTRQSIERKSEKSKEMHENRIHEYVLQNIQHSFFFTEVN